ncbi:MAG: hypothetical protein ABI547_05030 [Betaproteobacteria bacterium]
MSSAAAHTARASEIKLNMRQLCRFLQNCYRQGSKKDAHEVSNHHCSGSACGAGTHVARLWLRAQPEAARALIRFLTTPAAARVIKSKSP